MPNIVSPSIVAPASVRASSAELPAAEIAGVREQLRRAPGVERDERGGDAEHDREHAPSQRLAHA